MPVACRAKGIFTSNRSCPRGRRCEVRGGMGLAQGHTRLLSRAGSGQSRVLIPPEQPSCESPTPPERRERPRGARPAHRRPPAEQPCRLELRTLRAGGLWSPLQAVHPGRGGLQAAAAGAGAQGHGLGGPGLPRQQHGGLRGGEGWGVEEGWAPPHDTPSWGAYLRARCPGSEGHLSPGGRWASLTRVSMHPCTPALLHPMSNSGRGLRERA